MPSKELDPRLEMLLAQPKIWGELFSVWWRSTAFNALVNFSKRPILSRPQLNFQQRSFLFSVKHPDFEATQQRLNHKLEITWRGATLNAQMTLAALMGRKDLVNQSIQQLEELINQNPDCV